MRKNDTWQMQDALHKMLETAKTTESNEKSAVSFLNYKDMCQKLQIKPTSGEAKQIQLRTIAEYCNLSKTDQGRAFYYTEVYDMPQNTDPQTTMLAHCIEGILLSEFTRKTSWHTATNEEGALGYTANQLMKLLGMVNPKFDTKLAEKTFLERTRIDVQQLRHFKERTRTRLLPVINSVLDSLFQQRLIRYNTESYIIIFIGEDGRHHAKVATEQESAKINRYEKRILKKMNCQSMKDVWQENRWKEFNRIRDEYIQRLGRRNKTGWIRVFDAYSITCLNKDWLARNADRDIRCGELRQKINQDALLKLAVNAQVKLQNYTEEKRTLEYKKDHPIGGMTGEQFRHRWSIYLYKSAVYENNYLQNQEALTEQFVKL